MNLKRLLTAKDAKGRKRKSANANTNGSFAPRTHGSIVADSIYFPSRSFASFAVHAVNRPTRDVNLKRLLTAKYAKGRKGKSANITANAAASLATRAQSIVVANHSISLPSRPFASFAVKAFIGVLQ